MTNDIRVNMIVGKDAIENIKTAMANHSYDDTIGAISLTIVIEGKGYSVPIRNAVNLTKDRIVKLLNNARLDIESGVVRLTYEIKPITNDDESSDLVRF